MKKLFLGSSQTQECSDVIVKAEQVHIAVWEEFRISNGSSETTNDSYDSGCRETIASLGHGVSESEDNVFSHPLVSVNYWLSSVYWILHEARKKKIQ